MQKGKKRVSDDDSDDELPLGKRLAKKPPVRARGSPSHVCNEECDEGYLKPDNTVEKRVRAFCIATIRKTLKSEDLPEMAKLRTAASFDEVTADHANHDFLYCIRATDLCGMNSFREFSLWPVALTSLKCVDETLYQRSPDNQTALFDLLGIHGRVSQQQRLCAQQRLRRQVLAEDAFRLNEVPKMFKPASIISSAATARAEEIVRKADAAIAGNVHFTLERDIADLHAALDASKKQLQKEIELRSVLSAAQKTQLAQEERRVVALKKQLDKERSDHKQALSDASRAADERCNVLESKFRAILADYTRKLTSHIGFAHPTTTNSQT